VVLRLSAGEPRASGPGRGTSLLRRRSFVLILHSCAGSVALLDLNLASSDCDG
jgi:hypothetical protein